MTLSGHHHDISWLGYLAREFDRQCPFGDDEKIFSLLFIFYIHRQLFEYLQSVLRIGIIVRCDQDIAELVSYRSHDWPFGLVPVSWRSEKRYQSSRSFYFIQILQGLFQCVRRVCEIHEIEYSFVLYMLHPSIYGFKGRY